MPTDIHILQTWKNANCKTRWNIRSSNDRIENTNTSNRLGRPSRQNATYPKGCVPLILPTWVKHVACCLKVQSVENIKHLSTYPNIPIRVGVYIQDSGIQSVPPRHHFQFHPLQLEQNPHPELQRWPWVALTNAVTNLHGFSQWVKQSE